jgi:hypothetical protein
MTVNYRTTLDSTCFPPSSHERVNSGAPVSYQGRPNILEADPSAGNGSTKGNKAPENTSFSVNRQFTYVKPVWSGLQEKRYVTWTGHAYRMGKCSDHQAPIKAGDPIINHEKVDIDADYAVVDPNPDVGADTNVTKVRIRVTCEGVPIENVGVLINVDAQDKSGGHVHSDDDRPRGTIDGQVVTGAAIPRNTDSYGQVRITYGSPLTGVPDHAGYGIYNIGIAGTYEIKAKTKDVLAATGQLAVMAKVDGLIGLPATYVHCCDTPGVHPVGTYGTPTTLSEFGSLASDFNQSQVDHNVDLQNCQNSTWGDPVPVSFNDIALPDGGIFDLDSDWQPSHFTHNRGEGGDFNRFTQIPWSGTANGIPALGPDCNGPPIKRRAWLLHTLLSIGQTYGKWDCKDLGHPPGCDQGDPPTSVAYITSHPAYPPLLHLHVQDATTD